MAVEGYPHTIHVRLFDLPERIPYKPKSGRTVSDRKGAMRHYQDLLSSLLEQHVHGVLDNPDVRAAIAHETATSAKGKSLKRLDDTLDGITCALAAALMWKSPSSWERIGDLNGYIVVPRETL